MTRAVLVTLALLLTPIGLQAQQHVPRDTTNAAAWQALTESERLMYVYGFTHGALEGTYWYGTIVGELPPTSEAEPPSWVSGSSTQVLDYVDVMQRRTIGPEALQDGGPHLGRVLPALDDAALALPHINPVLREPGRWDEHLVLLTFKPRLLTHVCTNSN